jgi:hypothetical protein
MFIRRMSDASLFPHRIALLGCALLALTIFAPAVVEAVPLTLSLDNPNQSVAAPPSGTTILDFSGTITVDAGYRFNPPGAAFIGAPFNASGSHSLDGMITAAFDAFFNDLSTSTAGGTFTGTIFQIFVPAGTPPALYAYHLFPDLSDVFLRVQLDDIPNTEFTAQEPFSILVTGGTVPDRGSSILLLGLSLAALCSVQRAFVSRAKRRAT